MSLVYQKAFDHLDVNSRPIQFIDRHLLHHEEPAQAVTRSSPLAHHAPPLAATQTSLGPSPLQKFGAQQMAKPLPVSSSADSSTQPPLVSVPPAVVPTGHGVSSWIQQHPSSNVPIVTQSMVNPSIPTMSAHHVSATPSAKVVIPMQATATAFTTQQLKTAEEGENKPGEDTNLQKAFAGVDASKPISGVDASKPISGEEARSGSTGAPQILKKHKRRHAKKVKARPSTCGCC